MPDCELLHGCPFYNDRMKGREATAELYKMRYCRADSAECARYLVFRALGRPCVPGTLFPNDHDQARSIIDAGRSACPGAAIVV
ncbi:MAG: hypothetical protein HY903_17215 [Deltaproteobacteria bacterium]|nr:hypothetical protein [Deltaproteobacteria bacterium]